MSDTQHPEPAGPARAQGGPAAADGRSQPVPIAEGGPPLPSSHLDAVPREQVEAPPESVRWQAQRLEALGGMAGGVAHEFNNLLTVALANLEPLGRGADERTNRRVARAADAVRRVARLTQQVLAFARRRRPSLGTEAVDLREVLAGLDALIGQAAGSGVRVTVELPDRPVPARLDAGALEVALLHLAHDARASMPAGGGLRIALLDEGADGACLLVARAGYAGYAVAPEVAAAPTAMPVEPSSGTGVPGRSIGHDGLSAPVLDPSPVAALVRRSGGSMHVAATPGRGTEIALRFPRGGAAVGAAGSPPGDG